ncbi:DUF1963 domain-containing protein [Qipengyuania flava]|uniref:DUF1963 domain-containing protein n=1 Tax=Qipengyuania flava TaxID=192812 RepID=UPI001C624E7C|nr:DUF1963 domain-containing protein [Qipengyuania flava]QYJ07940.1 DUF1963 domain-containing protein [Qipengyuania flava]
MDIRILVAVGISVVLLGAAWLVMRARAARSARLDEQAQVASESDRVASERLSRLAATRREQEERAHEQEEEADPESETGELVSPEFAEQDQSDPPPAPAYEAEPYAPAETLEKTASEPEGPEQWSTLLVPQVPIDRDAPLRSWLGGRPHLPFGAEWPEADGKRYVFFAGICLADLDERMWHGEGPREGWMLVFLHPETNAPHLIHVATIGTGEDERPDAFAFDYSLFGPFGGFAADEPQGRRIPRCFAEWPVTLELQDETVKDGSGSAPTPGPDTFDFANPALHPVDEFAMLALLDAINDDFAAVSEARYSDNESVAAESRKAVDELRRKLTQALEAEKPDQDAAASLRAELSRTETQHNNFVSEVDTNTAAQAHLLQLAEMVRDHATKNGLKPAEIAQIMEGLAEVPVAARMRGGKDGDRRLKLVERPLTQVTAGDPHPGSSMIPVAIEHAKQAYTRRPDVLTDEQNAFWSQYLAAQARAPLGKIGGAPTGAGAELEQPQDVLLLELESARLVGWTFADGGRMRITLARSDLRSGAFDQARVDMSES